MMENQSLLQKYDPNAFLNVQASSSTVTVQGLETGLCNIAILNQNTFVSDVASNTVNLTEVAVDEGALPYSVIVASNSTLTTLAQTQTATWVNTGPGSQSAVSEEILWGQQGWTSSKISQIVSASAAGSLDAVISGKAVDFSSTAQAVPQLLGGQLRAVYNESFPWPIEVIVATPAYLKANPSAMQAAVDASLAANAFLNTPSNQNFIDKLVLPSFPGYTAQELNTLDSAPINNFPNNGAVSTGALQQLIDYQFTYGVLSKNVSATGLVTGGYAPVTS
jgi:ABC-type nitrate/sulfonate/bicarbonate transport system substrate-binding protein